MLVSEIAIISALMAPYNLISLSLLLGFILEFTILQPNIPEGEGNSQAGFKNGTT